MTTRKPTFATTVPAYFLGRPRSMYEARYQQVVQPAPATSSAPVLELTELPAAA